MQTDNNQNEEIIIAKLIQTAKECHHLSDKKAQTFAKQARALQKNLALRKKQQQERLMQEADSE